MKILIKNGRVIDPANNIDEITDVLINKSIIEKVKKNIDINDVDKVIDAKDKWVTPGFIDLHVHLREPGFEYKETIATGSKSAAKGGFTTICCMPNTKPVIDNEVIVEYIKMKAEREAVVNVIPIGSITKNQEGKELSDIGKMAKLGICAISEDGYSVENPVLMKSALKYARMFNLPVFAHCEDLRLTGRGQINAGNTAALLGLGGIPDDSESSVVSRDMILAQTVKAQVHICHVSTKQSVALIKAAKSEGQKVTAEVTPHHFTLIDEDIIDYDANYKMAPPLRSIRDRDILIKALQSGIIDAIATDHAPHHYDDKNCEFEKATNGIIGLETAFPLSYTELVEKNGFTPLELIEKLTFNPAKIIRSNKGTLSEGMIADITIVDVNKEYTIDVNKFASKSSNSPFHGRKVKGLITHTIVNGKIVVENSELI